MTTTNHMIKASKIVRQFAGREYINSVGGENRFKDLLTEKVMKDSQAADTLVNIMVKSSPSCYLYFTYKKNQTNPEGIRFYYFVNHPVAAKSHIYRKNPEDPLVNNCQRKCYVIVEYKRRPNAQFLAISVVARKNDIDVFNGKSAGAFDGYHIE
jgi:hypothetical protein